MVLDEEVSDVVVRIFLWKKSGMKEREIAKKLSAQGIQTPFTRRCQLGYLKNTLRVPSMADRFRDKGAGKSNLHRNNGL